MAWYNSAWLYRKKITVDATKVGGSDLTDFPVYVDLSNLGSDFHDKVQSDGGDIVVTSSDETTKLSRELVAIDTSADTGELYFKAPSLSSSVNTVFYIYYGNAAATETNDTATWKSTYSAVYHMKDLTTSTVDDSTTNGRDGTKTSAGNPVEATGKIGMGQTFSSDLIDLGDNAVFDFGTGEFAFFVWSKTNSGLDNRFALGKLENAGNFDGPAMGFSSASNYMFMRYRTGATNYNAEDTVDVTDDSWNRFVGLRRSTGIYLYRAGAQVGSNTDGNTQNNEDNADTLVIGSERSGSTASTWPGTLDEIYVWKGTAPTDGWILADYNNQSAPNTFYAVAAEESNGGGNFLAFM